jgi:hypothetical protein
MDFNCIPLEVQAIIVNLYPCIQNRLVSKNFNKFTQSWHDKAASIINKQDILKIPTKPFVIMIDNISICYVTNTNIEIYSISSITHKVIHSCQVLRLYDYSQVDYLTYYNLLIQRGCTPKFVKNLIVNNIKLCQLELYSKSVKKYTYLWLYANAAILGFTDIAGIVQDYDRQYSFELYHKILNYFMEK